MSLILDALNRSRQDASEDAVPGIGTHHPVEQVSSGARQYIPWVVLAVVVVVIGWLVIGRMTAPSESTSGSDIGAPLAELSRNIGSVAESVTTELKSRVESEKEGPVVRGGYPPVLPATKPGQEEIAIVNNPAAVQSVQEVIAVNDPEDVVRAEPVNDNNPVAHLYQQTEEQVPDHAVARGTALARVLGEPRRAAPAQPERREETIDIEEILERARGELASTGRVDEHPAPFITKLSQSKKDSIPTLLYQQHDYSTVPGQSSVILNGKTLKVGGRPASGLTIDEILPNSVVLSHQGTQFRLSALNSWVNL